MPVNRLTASLGISSRANNTFPVSSIVDIGFQFFFNFSKRVSGQISFALILCLMAAFKQNCNIVILSFKYNIVFAFMRLEIQERWRWQGTNPNSFFSCQVDWVLHFRLIATIMSICCCCVHLNAMLCFLLSALVFGFCHRESDKILPTIVKWKMPRFWGLFSHILLNLILIVQLAINVDEASKNMLVTRILNTKGIIENFHACPPVKSRDAVNESRSASKPLVHVGNSQCRR